MIFYLILSLISVLFLIVAEFLDKGKKVISQAFATFLAIISAIRYDVGFDYPVYYEVAAQQGDFLWEFLRFEFISKIIVFIVWLFKVPYLIFFIYSFLTIYFVFQGLKRLMPDGLHIGLFIYALFPLFFIDSFSLIRQHLAIALIFYAISFLLNRRFLPYIIIVCISGLIHSGSFITILLIPMSFVKIRPWVFASLIGLTFVFGRQITLMLLDISGFSSSYLSPEGVKGTGGSLIRFLMNGIALGLLFLYNRLSEKAHFYIRIFSLGILFYNLFGSFGHAGIRVFEYFSISIVPLMPMVVKAFKPQRLVAISACLVLLVFNLSYISLTTRNEKKSALTPYSTIFTTEKEGKFK